MKHGQPTCHSSIGLYMSYNAHLPYDSYQSCIDLLFIDQSKQIFNLLHWSSAFIIIVILPFTCTHQKSCKNLGTCVAYTTRSVVQLQETIIIEYEKKIQLSGISLH